jgi:hypothetical protein
MGGRHRLMAPQQPSSPDLSASLVNGANERNNSPPSQRAIAFSGLASRAAWNKVFGLVLFSA